MIDQSRRNDQSARIDDFRFRRLVRPLRDFAIDDEKIADLIALVRGIDDAAVANESSFFTASRFLRTRKRTAMRTARPLVT